MKYKDCIGKYFVDDKLIIWRYVTSMWKTYGIMVNMSTADASIRVRHTAKVPKKYKLIDVELRPTENGRQAALRTILDYGYTVLD